MPTVIDSISGISTYQPEYSGRPYTASPYQQERLPMVDRAQDMALMALDHPTWVDWAQDRTLLAADHRGLVISNLV